ncbi:MAG: hypothetical protein ACREBD_35860 [Blastocatellia bacterium]
MPGQDLFEQLAITDGEIELAVRLCQFEQSEIEADGVGIIRDVPAVFKTSAFLTAL